MRTSATRMTVSTFISLAAALIFSATAIGQATQPQQSTDANAKWRYNGLNRVQGTGGTAPVHDFTGTWAGPRSGAGVPDNIGGEKPTMTALGQKLYAANKPLGKFSPAGTNDATVRTCDPFGFPRNDVDEIRGLSFATMPDRIVLLYQFQQVWREVWTDGRALPKNVGAAQKGAPDPRYFGYSVGHWENDNTLVIETTGLDERTWLTGGGYPHTTAAHVEERFTRADHNDLKLTITVDDPMLYAKPFSLGTVLFRWVPNQLNDEKLCVPSEVIEYLSSIGDPAGSDPDSVKGDR